MHMVRWWPGWSNLRPHSQGSDVRHVHNMSKALSIGLIYIWEVLVYYTRGTLIVAIDYAINSAERPLLHIRREVRL